MRPRFVGRLGPADAITVANGMLGFLAAAVAPHDPRLAARFVLLAAVGDGLDGIVARRVGGTPAGEYLDSLSDVAAFGVAPAFLVTALAVDGWAISPDALSARTALAVGVPALFLGMTVVRLGLYTAYDAKATYTEGAPGTLAATVIAAAVLAGAVGPTVLVGLTALLSYLMVTRIPYPDLLPLDAFLMGVVQGLAILFPDAIGRGFPYAVLTLAVTYLVLAPRFYWGWGERSERASRGPGQNGAVEGKRS